MRRLLSWFLLLFHALAPVQAVESLPAPPGVKQFRSYGVDEGLTNPSVVAMAQDPDGFLWVGTEDGLFRLEGNRFRRFDEEDGLPSSRIGDKGLAPGLHHGLWVQTNRGLAFWNGRKFQRPSALGTPGLDDRTGVCLAQGGVILSNREAQVRYLSLDGEAFKPLEGLPWGNGLTAGTYDATRGQLLLCLGQELWVRTKEAWNHRDLSRDLGQAVLSVWVDGKGQVWLRTAERLFRLASPQAPVESVPVPFRLSVVNSSSLGIDGEGRLWTNSAQGVVVLDNGRAELLGEPEGLPEGGAVVLAVDGQGSIWMGGYGVHKLLGDGLWTGYTRKQGLPTDVVWTVSRTRDGLLWAGSAAGLAVGDAKGWKVLPRTRSNQFMALAEDSDGNFWTGHQPSVERPTGLSVRPKGSLELKAVRLPALPPQGQVSSLLSEGNTLWLGTSQVGLLKATRKGLDLQADPVVIGDWPKEDSINRVAPDGRGGLWVAGLHGVAHWNGATWAVASKASGLLDANALMVVALPGDEAWVSYVEAKGMTRVKREGGRIRVLEQILPPHPLVRNPIVSMERRPDGSLWLGTSRGLLRWDGQRIDRFGRHTGFPGEDCAQYGLWFDPNGDVWVGLSVGLVRGHLADRDLRQDPPATSLMVAARGDGRSLLEDQETPQVPWAGRTLTFQYGPKGSRGTEDLSYQVRLVGLEDGWRTTSLPEARYPGLAAGEYRFEVRTVNSVGALGAIRSLEFRILPPWWRRTWFLALAGVALAFLGYRAFRWRTEILRRRNILLEALVKARTQELETANQALREASLIDPLTGLHNRRFLTMTMPEEEIRLRRMFRTYLLKGESPLSRNEDLILFLCDLDHFKHVNDTYGHAAGDFVLQETAKVLRTVCRTSDTLVRWGGEEFLLVAKRSDRHKADLIADKLCQALRHHPFLLADGRELRCTVSVGYAAFPILDQNPEAFSWEDTLQVADQCLYAAKHAGRDGWVGVHTPGPVDAESLAPRFRVDLEGLVLEGVILAKSSFPEGQAFRGKDITLGS